MGFTRSSSRMRVRAQISLGTGVPVGLREDML